MDPITCRLNVDRLTRLKYASNSYSFHHENKNDSHRMRYPAEHAMQSCTKRRTDISEPSYLAISAFP